MDIRNPKITRGSTSSHERYIELTTYLMYSNGITQEPRPQATPMEFFNVTCRKRVFNIEILGVTWGRGYYTLYDGNIMLLRE